MTVIPVLDLSGGWFSSAYTENGDCVFTSPVFEDVNCAIRSTKLWLSRPCGGLNGWPDKLIEVWSQ